jgi:hypothetical protein
MSSGRTSKQNNLDFQAAQIRTQDLDEEKLNANARIVSITGKTMITLNSQITKLEDHVLVFGLGKN